MDWEMFEPVPGVNQIVGHTPGKQVREKTIPGSRNLCVDVGNASVAALLSDGNLTILEKE
jgi:hypothetical protein